jgi:hypothetical protein
VNYSVQTKVGTAILEIVDNQLKANDPPKGSFVVPKQYYFYYEPKYTAKLSFFYTRTTNTRAGTK